MGSNRSRWYVLGATVATVAYYVSGHPSLLFHLIGASSAVAILVAARAKPRLERMPWYLFALGQALFISGDILAYNYDRFFGHDLPYPSIADVLYLAVYPCLAAGLLLVIGRRSTGRDRNSLLDSLMVGIGVGTLSWAFLISPYALDSSMRWLERLVAMSYPLMDLMVLVVAVRLAVGAGRRSTAFLLIFASVIVLFATDAIYGWLLLHEGYTPGSGWLEVGWIAFYVSFGAAALHPTSGSLASRPVEPTATTGRFRSLVFGVPALAVPCTALVLALRGDHGYVPLMLAATMALFVIAMMRMFGLMRDQANAVQRADVIRRAGTSLLGAPDTEAIVDAALEAVRMLTPATTLGLWRHDEGEGAYVGTDPAGAEHRLTLDDLDPWQRVRLADREPFQTLVEQARVAAILAPGPDVTFVYVEPWHVDDRAEFLLVLGLATPLAPSATLDLVGLSSQVSLALESARLAEALYVKQGEARLTSLVKNSADVFLIIDTDTTIRYVSPSVRRVLGSDPEALEGTRLLERIHAVDRPPAASFFDHQPAPDASASFECRMRLEDGSSLYVEVNQTNLLEDPNVRGIVVNVRDISERKAFEEQLSHQAFHDPVTGLANRALFRDRVHHALERRRRSQVEVAILFLDLDDFKSINDTLGHAAGDLLLRQVGQRLDDAVREADTAARIGGDEFALLLDDPSDATPLAERILAALEPPFTISGHEVLCRASIGIAMARHGEDTDAEELLRDADVAMYLAKENGKGRYEMFDPSLHERSVQRMELRTELQHALERGELVLHYQPVIELRTSRIVGFEALLRWEHPARGLIPPLDFIPLAEETGLIVPIGEWVLRTACAFAIRLNLDGRPIEMAVNLSARQFSLRSQLVDQVRRALDDTGLDPQLLTLELTETLMMWDIDASIDLLQDLKALGVRLAIDDFGTGYSSLNYVRRFPVDILKIDKSFVDSVESDPDQAALTSAVVDLARVLRLVPLAEGIEREGQLEQLMELGCELGQGFLFARPLVESAALGLLAQHGGGAAGRLVTSERR